ncbi:arylsulfatase B-like [Oppia nitens]|uniref:arylsulfatase B-like n=1 Tax=Oppia nitens TaxID=1686743 RepID=UPI0023DAED7A|nr:arylsulfatase B-like [Oppia nitens]
MLYTILFKLFYLMIYLSYCHTRPNIVFILADDLGWGDVSIHGSTQVRTPNIDVLANNGIILNNYYVSPICTPSRSALMTGYHPIHTGLYHNVIYNTQPWGLPLKYKILPQYLQTLGYESHIVGKWHLGFFKRDYLPTNRGFDSHFGFWTGHTDYYQRLSGDKPQGYDFRDNENPIDLSQYQDMYLTDILTNKSVDIINNRKDPMRPLFLFVAHNAVHAALKKNPLQAPQLYIDRFKHVSDKRRRKFCAMVSALDDSVADIVAALQVANIINNTIIIFSTDNGAATKGNSGWSIDNSIGSNWPLRGAKYTLFEGGVRGFAFIWSPLLKRKYRSEHLMHIQDWLPTIYSAAGGHTMELGPIDGIDMWKVLNDNLKSNRKELLHNIDNSWNVWALRSGNYKLLYGQTFDGQFNNWYQPPGESIVANKQSIVNYKESNVYKLFESMSYNIKPMKQILIKCNAKRQYLCEPKVNACLFDIRSDPCEYNNLYHQKPEIVQSMLKLLDNYNTSIVKPCNQPYDEKADPIYHNNWWSVWQ